MCEKKSSALSAVIAEKLGALHGWIMSWNVGF